MTNCVEEIAQKAGVAHVDPDVSKKKKKKKSCH